MYQPNFTCIHCKNCGKEMKPEERQYTECTECQFHALNGTRTIEEYNKWLLK